MFGIRHAGLQPEVAIDESEEPREEDTAAGVHVVGDEVLPSIAKPGVYQIDVGVIDVFDRRVVPQNVDWSLK